MSAETMNAALEQVAKWRRFFAQWQLGERMPDDGEFKAVAHQRELYILLRVEVSALIILLLRKGVFTEAEFEDAVEAEARHLDRMFAEAYPGWSSEPTGMHMDLPAAAETMVKMGFPIPET